ncbi:DUF2158 domain-containing protein [Pseudomonas sp. M2]|uniref:DUF2158 domain-containing protein n=1 Tax=Pseudomonas sp. M2 TaxID=228756 RepID=UPI0018CBDCBC|nr:DUF2158 domain-containing protein [Pseudomonas sp. M2]MBG6126907.1 uncharacterized protein YodC (DUF2158 family) [Pseudomonas sp. M2]HDS1748088.1 DUF2158 domain-containing protein [Pseudomonas putida]
MSQQEFEIGAMVKLNVGGPDMSVKAYRPSSEIYICQWFAGKKLEQGEFKSEGLVRITADEED